MGNRESLLIKAKGCLLASEVGKPSKILIKILNVTEYIKSNIQNIEAPRADDPIV